MTFVNGVWIGTVQPNEPKALESCPQVWDYLNAGGLEGWELAGVAPQATTHEGAFSTHANQLILKRPF